jgi:hypothetical protein
VVVRRSMFGKRLVRYCETRRSGFLPQTGGGVTILWIEGLGVRFGSSVMALEMIEVRRLCNLRQLIHADKKEQGNASTNTSPPPLLYQENTPRRTIALARIEHRHPDPAEPLLSPFNRGDEQPEIYLRYLHPFKPLDAAILSG